MSYKTKEQRAQDARDIFAGVTPQAKYRDDWQKAVRTFKRNAQDPAFAETLAHDRIRLELFIDKLIERRNVTRPDEAISHFLSHHHVFNRYSLADKEEIILKWVESLNTSEQRARVLGSHAWLRNILRNPNKKSEYTQLATELLDSLSTHDLKAAVLNINSHLRTAIDNYMPRDKAHEWLDKIAPKM